ncbi:MAG: RluA family pseudouridine synthase [Gammaproteobacteria bacterium]|nr:RluA family pseudouridine synthase [Gammaproteobacteria bacterium]
MAERSAANGGVRLLTVDEGSDGQRLDNYLIGQLKGVPKSWIYRVMRRGEIRVNKGRCKPDRRIRQGDIVRIPPVRLAQRQSEGPAPGLIERVESAIVYEDDGLLIVNKPSGVAVHGGSGLSHGVIEILRAARPNAPFLELAHRLDRDTSGCLMVAKTRPVLRDLQDRQRAGAIDKRYLALLVGSTRKGAWRVDQPLRKNTLKGGERVVRVDPEGKAAITDFEVIRRFRGFTLVSAKLGTGRTHQIRVHAAAVQMPLAGDAKYGDEAANRTARGLGLKRLFLHAASLSWAVGTRQSFSVEAPLPEELQSLLDQLAEHEA